jgi:hypothetical protein
MRGGTARLATMTRSRTAFANPTHRLDGRARRQNSALVT